MTAEYEGDALEWDAYDEDGKCIGRAYIDEDTGVTVYPDDKLAQERIRLIRILDARITLEKPDASPGRKAFAREILRKLGVEG